MNRYLRKLPAQLKTIIGLVSKVSFEMKIPAYLVGGCLRDLILGFKNFDLDLAIEGDGIMFARQLAKRLKSGLNTHERFGTATLILENGLKVDIASTRSERYPLPGALPVVSSGSLIADLGRRDFTINALAVKITAGKKQEIIDPYAGQSDLALGQIRVLHNLSFRDDPTRIFRAIRFSQRFDFKIEPRTRRLLKQAISDGLLEQVHPHRLRNELVLMLKECSPFGSVRQIYDWGGLFSISPNLKISKSTENLYKAIAKQIAGFAKKFPKRRRLDQWLIYFMGLIGTLTLAQMRAVMHKLGLRQGEQKRVLDYYRKRPRIVKVLSKKQVCPEQVYALLEPLSYEAIILLSATSTDKNLKKYLTDFLNVYNVLRLEVSGQDLEKLGVLPGPRYQKILTELLAAKLNGRLKSRSAELALMEGLARVNKKGNGENNVKARTR